MRAATFGAGLLVMTACASVSGEEIGAQSALFWSVPDVGALPYDAHGLLVRRGRDLIVATYAHIGPDVPDRRKIHSSYCPDLRGRLCRSGRLRHQ
jgi:thiosulfate dehydrogenase